jgi:KUP system potassium uptake protein
LIAAETVATSKHSASSAGRWLAVLGVVYGDIGTSPLYALKSSMQVFEGVPISEVEILGILSLFSGRSCWLSR